MSSTLADLTATLQRLLMEHFHATAPGSEGQPFLAFELGSPIPDETFHLPADNPDYSPAVALEYMSHQANMAPRIVDGVLMETSNRIDNLYEMLLVGSIPATAESVDLLGMVKSSALASFDVTLSSSLGNPLERFHPVHADPINWYDAQELGNWTRLSLDRFDDPPPPPPPPPTSPSPGSGPGFDSPPSHFPLMWRPVPRKLQLLLARPASPASLRQFDLHATTAEAAMRPRGHAPTASAPMPVTSDGFSITVDVCLVHLRRPWFSDGLMQLDNWFVGGVPQGQLCSGRGPRSTTPLSVLPIACVCIRNLAISARWSDTDRGQLETSSHLGTFALLGRRFDNETATISVAGMQAIGWICEPLPELPPRQPA